MKVLYIVKTQLHYYPPCISQIRMLKDLGYDVEVLYGTSNESALKLLAKENIPCHKVAEIKDVASSKIEKMQDEISRPAPSFVRCFIYFKGETGPFPDPSFEKIKKPEPDKRLRS